MFSESGFVQEIVTLVVAFGALSFVVHKLTGWPRRAKKPTGTPVVVGDRLAKGLDAARNKNAGQPEPPQ